MSRRVSGVECIPRFLDSMDNAVLALRLAWSGHHGDRFRVALLAVEIALLAVIVIS